MTDISSILDKLTPGTLIKGPMFNEPVIIITITDLDDPVEIKGQGVNTNKVHTPYLSYDQVREIEFVKSEEPFCGDAKKFKLAIEAMRIGLAYEYDPYFSLSIARIDPLPHQLEAVYDYFLKLPRIRFLLADDPGAGKTIMAGLLIKELKNRGLIKRILLVTPANLTFQWQREMKEKFREQFQIVRGDILRSSYGVNPWVESDQAITSISWISVIPDAQDSLLKSHWDLVIVDESHKMSASSPDHKTLAYQMGERLAERTDHLLLMTATPHKGDPKAFRLFLELLDKDVYGDISSLEEAMRNRDAPFYLRRVKEALVTFPDPETGKSMSLFTKRNVKTATFEINEQELDLYDELTNYVEEQSQKAAQDNSARGRALGFTMAMLQRRFSSSIYALRQTLERMKAKREDILRDPEGYRKRQMERRLPDDFYELTEEEQQDILSQLEELVASYDPEDLKQDIRSLAILIEKAKGLEEKQIESKLVKLKKVITEEGIFKDPTMKLLIFTEHKDTLTYLVERLKEWGLTVTYIAGGMKPGSRNEPGSRLFAEQEFRDTCQILVATEAAGEGINLQFCWFMINYDIPWNPMRLEQRMGRIHRYGQEKDCLISNFVSTNTREGRVLQKLFERIRKIEDDLDPNRTGKIFNVLGDILPANQLEKMVRDLYARNLTEDVIHDRLIHDVNTERFRKITESALEGLAKRELNLSMIISKSAEAKEKRLVPEVIEDFFIKSGEVTSLKPKENTPGSHIFRVGRVPRHLQKIGENLYDRYGELGKEYKEIVFSKDILKTHPLLEWVTPGHILFEVVRADILEQAESELVNGAVFYDINRIIPAVCDVFAASVKDGRGQVVHRRLFVIETAEDNTITMRQPTLFIDLIPAFGVQTNLSFTQPDTITVKKELYRHAFKAFLEEVEKERIQQTDVVKKHVEMSLNELLRHKSTILIDLHKQKSIGDPDSGVTGRITIIQNEIDELTNRLERRRTEIEQERNCKIEEVQHIGRALILPHPGRKEPKIAPMVRDDEIERIAVAAVTQYEEKRGWSVESVEKDDRGFDLISRKPHPEDPKTSIEVRFIEVKGRVGVGEIGLTSNEYETAKRLKEDYWLYVVYNCGSNPEIHIIRDPVRLGWKPITQIAHYHVGSDAILGAVD